MDHLALAALRSAPAKTAHTGEAVAAAPDVTYRKLTFDVASNVKDPTTVISVEELKDIDETLRSRWKWEYGFLAAGAFAGLFLGAYGRYSMLEGPAMLARDVRSDFKRWTTRTSTPRPARMSERDLKAAIEGERYGRARSYAASAFDPMEEAPSYRF